MRLSRIPLVARILIGFVAGTVVGLVMSECLAPETTKAILPWIEPFGSVLVAMLKTVVFPIILFSLISGAAALPLRQSGRVGGTVLLWYTATSLFATLFGVALAYLMNPSMANAGGTAQVYMKGAEKIAGGPASGS